MPCDRLSAVEADSLALASLVTPPDLRDRTDVPFYLHVKFVHYFSMHPCLIPHKRRRRREAFYPLANEKVAIDHSATPFEEGQWLETVSQSELRLYRSTTSRSHIAFVLPL
jgi:hypothetical protein